MSRSAPRVGTLEQGYLPDEQGAVPRREQSDTLPGAVNRQAIEDGCAPHDIRRGLVLDPRPERGVRKDRRPSRAAVREFRPNPERAVEEQRTRLQPVELRIQVVAPDEPR